MLHITVKNIGYENDLQDLANALREFAYDLNLNDYELDEDGFYRCQVNGIMIEVEDVK
jgi:hypothetical protein